jgi:hypothetical protein
MHCLSAVYSFITPLHVLGVSAACHSAPHCLQILFCFPVSQSRRWKLRIKSCNFFPNLLTIFTCMCKARVGNNFVYAEGVQDRQTGRFIWQIYNLSDIAVSPQLLSIMGWNTMWFGRYVHNMVVNVCTASFLNANDMFAHNVGTRVLCVPVHSNFDWQRAMECLWPWSTC